jgi:hypothetical protein
VGQLFTVAGTEIALPPYTRPDLAYTTTVALADPAPATAATYRVTGAYYEVVLAIFFAYVASAAIGNRDVWVVYVDESGNTILVSPSPTGLSAGQVSDYNLSVNASGARVGTGQQIVIGLPALALAPGQSVVIESAIFQAGDQITAATITTIKIPTGSTTLAVAPAPLFPTPIAL